MLTDKTEFPSCLQNFVALSRTQFLKTIKVFCSNNGTEFTKSSVQQFFSDNGILFHSSCSSTPQQNGHVERKHQHILEVARALRFQASLPLEFWGECVHAAVYLINRTSSQLLGGKSLHEVLYSYVPSLNILRVFGCLCYAHNKPRKKDKFASRSRKCVFLGYPFGKKGWKVMDLETHELFVSRDVRFQEDVFPYFVSSTTVEALVDRTLYVDWDVRPLATHDDRGEFSTCCPSSSTCTTHNHISSEPSPPSSCTSSGAPDCLVRCI